MYFPVNSKTKAPLVSEWQNTLSEGQKTREEILEKHGAYGIALKQVPHMLIIDFDPRNYKKDSDGNILQDDEEEFHKKGWLPPTLIVDTPSGGKHYYYKNRSKVETRKKLSDYPGVDVLGKKSYVIGPGSQVKGKFYKSNSGSISDINIDLLNYVKRTIVEVTEVKDIDLETNLIEIRKLLAYLNADAYYSEWLNIGITIYNATEGALEGLNVWDEWSRGSKKYSSGECSHKWNTFHKYHETPRTLGSLYHEAIKNGYQATIIGDDLKPLETPVKQKDMSDLREELEEWAYINNQGTFYNYIQKNKLLSERLMRNYLRRAFPKGDPVPAFIRSPKCTMVDELTYEPGKPTFVEDDNLLKINKWYLPNINPVPGDASIFENHLKWLLEDDWQIARDWAAHIIQKPDQRITFMLLVIGSQGIGKSFIGNVLRALLGFVNVSEPSNDEIHDKYNGWCAKQVVVIPELMAKGRRELANKMKNILTDEVVSIHEKHVNPYLIKSCCSIFATSNYDTPILIDKDDRRHCILKSYRVRHPGNSELHNEEVEYYKKLWGWLKDKDTLPVLLHYLKHVDLKDFNHTSPPMTFAKRALIDDSSTEGVESLFKHWLGRRNCDLFLLKDFMEYLQTLNLDEYLDNRKVSYMIRADAQPLHRVRVQHRIERVYCKKEKTNKWKNKSTHDVMKVINKYKEENQE